MILQPEIAIIKVTSFRNYIEIMSELEENPPSQIKSEEEGSVMRSSVELLIRAEDKIRLLEERNIELEEIIKLKTKQIQQAEELKQRNIEIMMQL